MEAIHYMKQRSAPRTFRPREGIGARLTDLRKALGITQHEVAQRVEQLPQWYTKFETGQNDATSWAGREMLARAFGLPIIDMANYIDGKLGLLEALECIDRAKLPPEVSAARPRPSAREAAVVMARAMNLPEGAILRVLAETDVPGRSAEAWYRRIVTAAEDLSGGL